MSAILMMMENMVGAGELGNNMPQSFMGWYATGPGIGIQIKKRKI